MISQIQTYFSHAGSSFPPAEGIPSIFCRAQPCRLPNPANGWLLLLEPVIMMQSVSPSPTIGVERLQGTNPYSLS